MKSFVDRIRLRQTDNPQGHTSLPIVCVRWVLCAITIYLAGCEQSPVPSIDEPPPIEQASPPPGTTPAQPQRLVLSPQMVEEVGILVEPVKRGTFQNFRDYPGTVKPIESQLAEISTLVQGRVSKVFVKLGDEVKEGEELALLYSHELGLAQSTYLRAIAELSLAEKAFARGKYLLTQKVISQAKYLQRQGEWVVKAAAVQEAQERLRLLGMSDSQIQDLKSTHKFQSYLAIQAPFSGRIIHYSISRGEVVEPGTNLFTIANLKKVWVVANIPEIDISSIREGKTVTIRVASFPNERFTGTIVIAGDVLDSSTRTLMVRVEVNNEHLKLKPEMYASVRVYFDHDPQALTVPTLAVQRHQGSSFVFVKHDANHFELRPVILGTEDIEETKILSGLAEGEFVVTAGAFALKAQAIKQEVSIPRL
ncbi:MAG: efflux RND transporter periplasmic adaptor subunit [Nitrospirales bacterium]